MALIVQPFIVAKCDGHMSNERRVSQYPDKWRCEIAPRGARNGRTEIVKASPYALSNELLCKSATELKQQLAGLASALSNPQDRHHLEWVWDGTRLYVVQNDMESSGAGVAPGSQWKHGISEVDDRDLCVFVLHTKAQGPWKKISCVRDFQKLGLPTPNLYVLEDPAVIGALASGVSSPGLNDDLVWLTSGPLVIRTDALSAALVPDLPRTDTITSAADATKFLVSTAANLINGGLTSNDFCFIVHRFIPAIASAWSFARPHSHQVLVHSTWGFPDGLQYLPHDSFILDAVSGKIIQKQLRCKHTYVDITEDGSWVGRDAGVHYDWRASLNSVEISEIAKYSKSLADYLRKPVSIMFFVGVQWEGRAVPCIPWVYLHNEAQPEPSTTNRLLGDRLYVRNHSSYRDAEDVLNKHDNNSGKIIVLQPTIDLFRSDEFASRVAELALHYGIPVELEGSFLSHAYYILKRSNVRVICVDIIRPRNNKQKFGKLVRDLIPNKIEAHGETARTYMAGSQQLLSLLKMKAVEEALELCSATDPENIIEELADLLAVVDAYRDEAGISIERLKDVGSTKNEKRGGFVRGIVLLETDALPIIATNRNNKSGQRRHVKKPVTGEMPFQAFDPKTVADGVELSLIPPKFGQKHKEFIIPCVGTNWDFAVRYRSKTVEIRIQERVTMVTDACQMTLPIWPYSEVPE